MSVESTRQTMEKYMSAEHSDVGVMADDAVFTIMATGQEHRGPENIMGMLNYFYHVAFDATAETTNVIMADGQCCLEAMLRGKHIGEFAGVPASGKDVNVPLCVVYDVENDQIKRGRVYFEIPAFLAQVGAMPE